jgi:ribosomal protein S18 acetylase RimI-like enzyme
MTVSMDITPHNSFSFQPVVASQQSLIHQWLQQDYIREWVHGQGLKNLLVGLKKFIQYHAKTQKIDRTSALTQHWIGYDNDKPFVYLLTSNVFKDESSEYAKYSDTNGPIITLDIFICDPEYLGKGLAPQIIKAFLLRHFSDVTEVFIDPEKNNVRAVHVYQKIGFQILGEFVASWHPVPHYLMKLNMHQLVATQG